MKTSVKYLEKTKVELTITLGEKELGDAEQVALVKLANDVKVPGFRKGKVPANVATKHVQPEALLQQTMDDALSKAVAAAFTTEDIQVLERPEVEVKKFVPKQEMEFTAVATVLPKVKLGDYKKLKIAEEKVTVTAAEVNDVVERMRSGLSDKKEIKRAAKNGDEVDIDFVGKKDGVAFDGGTAKGHTLELGSNSFIPGFEEALVGTKAGDSKDIELKFPKEYHVDELAGAPVVFETKVNKVLEKGLPELNDEFAKKAGADEEIETLKDLLADIKKRLAEQKEREAVEKRKDALVQALVEKSEVPAPQILIDDQARSIEQDMQQNTMYRGITLEQYIKAQGFEDEDEWKKKEVIPAAEKRVKAGLLLAELSKELKVEATSEELADHLNMYRQQYANNPEAVKQFENPEVQRDIANRLLTEKTVEKLLELNK